jgi:hypothetical protein
MHARDQRVLVERLYDRAEDVMARLDRRARAVDADHRSDQVVKAHRQRSRADAVGRDPLGRDVEPLLVADDAVEP